MKYLKMDMERIMDVIRELAGSCGRYGRLYRDLIEMQENDPDRFDEIASEWEAQGFRSSFDLVTYLEG